MRSADGYLINKCLNGEPEAFGVLVDRYRASMFALAYSKLRNFEDAEDVTQDAFVLAYKNLRTLKQYDSFHAWLYSITSNLCKKFKIKQSKIPDSESIVDQNIGITERASLDSYREEISLESIHEALDSLPQMYQEVLTLHYLGGMNSDEIAETLGSSPSAIRQRLSRARMQLKEEIIAMMSETFSQRRLSAKFTFNIVEVIKKIKIHPVSTVKGLPWGLSLTTGIMITIMSLNPYVNWFSQIGTYVCSVLPSETKVLKVGEIPVDVVKTSSMAILADKMGKGKGEEPKQPNIQNAFFMTPQGEGEWTKKADMPTERNSFCAAVVNGKIYAIGGQSWAGIIPNVEEYDPAKDKWEAKSSMPQAKWCHCAVSVDGKIYAFGGQDINFNWLLSVFEYDPVLDKWTAKKDALVPFTASGVCALNSKIYAFGALNENRSILGKVCEYDPIADLWTEKSKMPTSRLWMDVCPVNGKIYVMGGIGDGNICIPTVEEYDPVADTWEKKSDMPTARAYLEACAVGTKIYAMGGANDNNIAGLKIVEVYDTLTDTWTKSVDMQTLRLWFSANVVGEKIYAIGGANGNNILSSVDEFDTGFVSKSVDPQDKLPTTWGMIKQR